MDLSWAGWKVSAVWGLQWAVVLSMAGWKVSVVWGPGMGGSVDAVGFR